ncbi:DUF983 domain-containing protein [Azospirillum thermophilum]|uniref:DUF983 domain-containing protein n=1 Tax=Azospirillum thermophilum TaxID=2202148 RepID=A0A2S2CM53_9PROT|nr:DUF983 domain-containing protein [Azospirillum thermophilum]AWK85595.1 hypothetical protein DEW08_04930 [Azospirillum thermophilum]
MTETHYPRVSPFTAGLRCACPRCGRGKLFRGFLTVADRCAVCGLDLARQDSGDGPAVFLIFILGFLVVPVALWVSMTVNWPLWLHTIVWSVVVLGLTLGMLRPAKAYVVALQYRYRRSDLEEGPKA